MSHNVWSVFGGAACGQYHWIYLSHLQPIERTTATEAVAQRLIGLVNDGHLRPGDRLPPERNLALQLGVGRTTVREALKLLTLSGLLEARRGSGTYLRVDFSSFVANQVEWAVLLSAQDVDQVFEVRESLELQAARLAAQRANPEDLRSMLVYQRLCDIPGRDHERETEIDISFHHAIAAASHNPLLLRLMLSVQKLLQQYVLLSNIRTDDLSSTLAEHEAVYRAIASRDPELAERAMARHLASSRETIARVTAGSVRWASADSPH